MSNHPASERESTLHRLWRFLGKNLFSILIGVALLAMLLIPDAKSWVLRQLMVTGIFNAEMETKAPVTTAPAVDFGVVNDQGKVQNTASFRGKVVFINFWASWCPPCRAEFPSIEKLYQTFQDHPGVVFLAVSEDRDFSAAKAYMEKERFSLPVYQAATSVPPEIYTGVLPTTVVLDKNGKIRYRHEGFANYDSEAFITQIQQLVKE